MKVLGIGDNVVDCYRQKEKMFPGGNSLNFCVYASLCGAEASLLSVLGNDAPGALVERALDAFGIGKGMLRRAGLPTNRCAVRLREGDRSIDDDAAYDLFSAFPLRLSGGEIEAAAGCDLVHTSVYAHIDGQLAALKAAGAYILYDFSHLWTEEALPDVCPQVGIGFFSLGHMDDREIETFLIRVHRMGCPLAVATMGKRGACVYDGRRFYRKRPYYLSGEVEDTLGAGDSFLTGFSLCYAEGRAAMERILGAGGGCRSLPEDREDYLERLIENALCRGNLLASRTCQAEGAFGMGVPLEE